MSGTSLEIILAWTRQYEAAQCQSIVFHPSKLIGTYSAKTLCMLLMAGEPEV